MMHYVARETWENLPPDAKKRLMAETRWHIATAPKPSRDTAVVRTRCGKEWLSGESTFMPKAKLVCWWCRLLTFLRG